MEVGACFRVRGGWEAGARRREAMGVRGAEAESSRSRCSTLLACMYPNAQVSW